MPTYKLTYFNAKGIAEAIRMLLSYSGKEFQDVRVEYSDWVNNLKHKMYFGKLPILEIDDKVVHQSMAICRYLGEEAGLSGKNNWENLQIDMTADSFLDFKTHVVDLFFEKEKEVKKKKLLVMQNETVPFYLERFDKIIKENGGYFALDKLSWFDFYFVGYSEVMEAIVEEKVCEKYPHISQLRKKLHDIPNIQQWIKKRPSTQF